MFPNNLTTDGLLKHDALQSAGQIILESSTDTVLPAYGKVFLKVEFYKTGKFTLVIFFTVDTKNEVIISHKASCKLGLLKVLYHNKATQHRQLKSVRIQTPQQEKYIHYCSSLSFARSHYSCSPFTRLQPDHSVIFKTIQQTFPHYKTIQSCTV